MNDTIKLLGGLYPMDKATEILPGKDRLCRHVNQK